MFGIKKQQLGMLALGQVVSLLLVGTNASSAVLAKRGFAAPMLQSFINYLLLALCYGSATCRKFRGAPSAGSSLEQGGMWPRISLALQFLVFAVADVEANYLIVLAYQYTSIMSITLLDCFTIPCVVVLSILLLGARYRWSHGGGVLLCLGGLILLVLADFHKLPDADAPAGRSAVKGDMLALSAAALYALSNTAQECLACGWGWQEAVGALGALGTLLSGAQCLALEYDAIHDYRWASGDVGALAVFVLSLFLLYSLVPHVLMGSGSAFLNLSLLTSDFWAILFGLTVLSERPSQLYPLAFVCTIAGLLVYHSQGEPLRSLPPPLPDSEARSLLRSPHPDSDSDLPPPLPDPDPEALDAEGQLEVEEEEEEEGPGGAGRKGEGRSALRGDAEAVGGAAAAATSHGHQASG